MTKSRSKVKRSNVKGHKGQGKVTKIKSKCQRSQGQSESSKIKVRGHKSQKMQKSRSKVKMSRSNVTKVSVMVKSQKVTKVKDLEL